jgi:hypothetical protein
MAEKIAESVWKAFTKKQKVELDDKELLKALARFDKTDEHKPEQRLEALKDLAKEVPKQVAALAKRKKELGDKPFGLVKDELYAILEEAEALQKKTQAALDAEDEEDEDSKPNALIDPKLLFKQLNMCRKDPDRTMKFAFVDAKDKQPAMLAMHPRMGARALFGKLQAAAGVKTGAYGSAWVDGMSLMLQLDKPLSGLVKKVRPPVKACGFRITKAVLWNEDGTVFEQDELPEEAVGEGQAHAAPGAPGAPAEPTQGVPKAPPQPSVTYETKLAELMPRVKKAADEGSPDMTKHQKLLDFAAGKAEGKDFLGAIAALKQLELILDNPEPKVEAKAEGGAVDPGMAFKARFAALIPQLKEARTAGRPGALDATAKGTEAGMAAGKGDFERAQALLDEAEALLEAAPAAGPAADPAKVETPGQPGAAQPGAAQPNGDFVRMQTCRLIWDAARKKVAREITQYRQAVEKAFEGEEEEFEVLDGLEQLDDILLKLDDRLIDTLDEMLGETAATTKYQALLADAKAQLGDYEELLASHPVLSTLDGPTEFGMNLSVASTLDKTLKNLRVALH